MKQLTISEVGAGVSQVHHETAPHHPHTKTENKRRHCSPEIAPGDFATGFLPKLGILGVPILNASHTLSLL